MVKIDRPKGLIAYDTIQNIERRQAGEKSGYRFIRGRTLFYGVLFVGIGGLMLVSLFMRTSLDVNVQRDRAPLFVPLSTGQVRNAYTVKVLNKADHTREVRIRMQGVEGGQLQANEMPVVDNSVVLTAGPDRVAQVRLFIVADPERLEHRSVPVMIEVTSPKDGEIAKSKSVFIRGDQSKERDDDD